MTEKHTIEVELSSRDVDTSVRGRNQQIDYTKLFDVEEGQELLKDKINATFKGNVAKVEVETVDGEWEPIDAFFTNLALDKEGFSLQDRNDVGKVIYYALMRGNRRIATLARENPDYYKYGERTEPVPAQDDET